ncbi:hypothetical protein Tcan_10698 [Toxocara canis]|uniref:Uncharacterized protein n=1 Tax=Toxocara canis TaxID=6265 RepID=A0A0B2VQ10_TOXCA|nr:hypothetical protein Tcan_10698 [Toxocara canis]
MDGHRVVQRKPVVMMLGAQDNPPSMKPETLAEEMLGVLLNDRNFQKYLVDTVVDHIVREASVTAESSNNRILSSSNAQQQKFEEKPLSVHEEIIASNVDTLKRLIDSVTETFLRSVDVALCGFGTDTNRDAAVLFSARIQIDRFLSSNRFEISRFEQSVRRLSTLLRTFATRISTPFQVANCAFFASSLCDILYRLEEYCSIHEKKSSQCFASLRTSIDDFYFAVVRHLNQMVLAHQEAIAKVKKKEEREKIRTTQKSPRRTRSAVTFREQLGLKSKSPGYLLPRDLQEKRASLRSAQRPRSAASMRRSVPAVPLGMRTSRTTSDIANKWSKLLNSEPVLRESLVSDEQGRAALRLAREITKDVVEELADRVDKMMMETEMRQRQSEYSKYVAIRCDSREGRANVMRVCNISGQGDQR